MKNINIEFSESEFKRVLKVKNIYKMNWKNFVLKMIEESVERWRK